MPSTYAHYYFGQRVLQALSPDLQAIIHQHRELFDLGLHGPDFFFYYNPLAHNHLNQRGNEMHEEAGEVFFSHAFSLEAIHDPAYLAYLYGFMCHFTLDAYAHPYIERYCRDHNVAHGDLEGEFERYLLVKNHFKASSYRLSSLLNATLTTANIIADFYPGVSAKEIYQCLVMMKTLHKVTHCPHSLKKNILLNGMSLIGLKSLKGHVIVDDPLDVCQTSNNNLDEIFEAAIPYAVHLISHNTFTTQDPLYKHTFGEN